MPYEAECVQTGCEFVTREETEQEVVDAMIQHTDEKHANMDVLDEEIQENITEIK